VPFLLTLSRWIDTFNARMGQSVAWLLVVAIVVSALNAIVRKVFSTSSNAWLESQWMLFGAVFLLCAPWTLMLNEHIRIDIVSSRLAKKTRNIIELIGHGLFLIPFCIIMVITSYPFFTRSAPAWHEVSAVFSSHNVLHWVPKILSLGEQSQNAGGLPQWPAKFLVLAGFVALLAQGISELIKRIAIMQARLEDTASGGGHHDAAHAEAQRLLDLANASLTNPSSAKAKGA
jgi:TRAP-type mannitol/chloroaromatic compound transport system permease small subunit